MQEFYTVTMLLSIGTFALSTSTTPGPNNIMLLSSGLTFGYKRTLPHILGIIIGFPVMVLLVGMGLGVVFQNFPLIFTTLKIVGMVYLFWMAYKIATNKSTFDVKEAKQSKPFSFMQAALFQWVNPKAWIMAITSISIFVTANENSYVQVIIVAFIYVLSGIVSCNVWTSGGVILKRFIKDEKSVHLLNIIMALLLVLCVIPFIFE